MCHVLRNVVGSMFISLMFRPNCMSFTSGHSARGVLNRQSPAHLRRSAARKKTWLERRSEQHVALPRDKIWLLHRLSTAAETSTGRLGCYILKARLGDSVCSGRTRDIFPLPLLANDALMPEAMPIWRWKIFSRFVDTVIIGMNFLYAVSPETIRKVRPTVGQFDVQARCVSRCSDFLQRLETPAAGTWEHLLPDWVHEVRHPEGPKYGDLVASKVDNLPEAGICNPVPDLPKEWQDIVTSADRMFPNPPDGLASFESFSSGCRNEYIKLVCTQLRNGKLGLASSVRGGGTVLAVGKADSQRQREVWHGKRVSAASVSPPPPRHLACPSALVHPEARPGKHIRVSKRDASCWFDQLVCPEELRCFMGRPPVSRAELYEIGGLRQAEVDSFLETGSETRSSILFPVSRVWPMGFSWSSCVAQEKLLAICEASGLDSSCILAADVKTPESFELVFAAATDDTMIFSDAGPGVTGAAAARLDDAMKSHGAIKNAGKDLTDQLDAVCVGIALEKGEQLGVPPGRCLAIVMTTLSLVSRACVSPLQVNQALGTLQWYDLLVRPKLSVYDEVYSFTRIEPAHRQLQAPPSVLDEILLGTFLGVYWLTDLRRPFLPLIGASDASTEFGFGASVARMPVDAVRKMARIAEKRGDYVVLDGCPASYMKSRLGEAHSLELDKADFTHVFSVRKRWPAHVNYLEGSAFLMLLRWILRSRARHCTRVVVLLDSAVWLGAAAKGRSGTMLNRLLRRAAALEMAGGLMLHLILVPSQENPSDPPSRGVRQKPAKQALLRSKRWQRLSGLCKRFS